MQPLLQFSKQRKLLTTKQNLRATQNIWERYENQSQSEGQDMIMQAIREYDNKYEEDEQQQQEINQSKSKIINFPRQQFTASEYQNCQMLTSEFCKNPQKQHIPMLKNIAYKKQVKPLRMFKDRIDLLAENKEKIQKYKKFQEENLRLKKIYQEFYLKNCQIQQFLKVIQFTFKNDQTMQKKANQTLLKAKKNLQREQKQSKSYFTKISKIPKNNYIKQLKSYLIAQKTQKFLLISSINCKEQKNTALLSQVDLNQKQMQTYIDYQHKLMQIFEISIQNVLANQKQYKKQKLIIKMHLLNKQINIIRKSINNTEQKIKNKLLEKQGIDYEIEILKNKLKQRNKKQMKEKQKNLSKEAHQKKIRILEYRKQLREKTKTNQYISKWTKQLKSQLQLLKNSHMSIKQQYQRNINKLSKQIEQWNRKYKAQLVEDQVYHKSKHNSINTTNNASNNTSLVGLPSLNNLGTNKITTNLVDNYKNRKQIFSGGNQNTVQENKEKKGKLLGSIIKNRMINQTNVDHSKKLLKYVTIDQINQIRKIVIFSILENNKYQNHEDFIRKQIIKDQETLSYEELKLHISQIPIFLQRNNPNQVEKLVRYILQDPNSQLTPKQSMTKTIDSKLCFLILKNLFVSELNSTNIQLCKKNLEQFFNKHYDAFRQNLWESSGKTLNFSIKTLEAVFQKYVAQQKMITLFVQYFQFSLWKRFSAMFVHKLLYFEMICEDILKKKLVKDRKKRISEIRCL